MTWPTATSRIDGFGGQKLEDPRPPLLPQTMIMNKPDHNADDLAARRKSARRTALWIAAIAVTIYVVFILSGTMGK